MRIVWALSAALLVALGVTAAAQDVATNSYTQTNLVSDIAGMAAVTDSRLINPWGLSRPAGTTTKEAYWWTADNGTGLSTLYNASGTITDLAVTIPTASGTGIGSPTGTVDFQNNFVFTTLDGTISVWFSSTGPATKPVVHPNAEVCTNCHTTNATIQVNHSSSGAVYTGVTWATNNSEPTLYVANSAGGVEAYNSSYSQITLPAGAFEDPSIPAGFTPFGIQSVGSKIYVTFANAPGAGQGYVDVFNTAGTLLLSLQHGNWMNQPWGIAQAPTSFGAFSQALLVGNLGSGEIAAFSPTTGKFAGFLKNSSGQVIAIPGLWAIYFGGGNTENGPSTTLYFNAGIKSYQHGLFGSITAN
jgi:uncharacterized protein (TIGR03118 family)